MVEKRPRIWRNILRTGGKLREVSQLGISFRTEAEFQKELEYYGLDEG